MKKMFAPLICTLILILLRLSYYLLDRSYDFILNVNDYYLLSCLVLTLFMMLLFFCRKKLSNYNSKYLIIATIVASLAGFGLLSSKLPVVKYNEAVSTISEDLKSELEENIEVVVPDYKSDKMGYLEYKFLRVSNYVYYIYVLEDSEKVIYRFDPINGHYKKIDYIKWFE